jgi:hypothetical protein
LTVFFRCIVRALAVFRFVAGLVSNVTATLIPP